MGVSHQTTNIPSSGQDQSSIEIFSGEVRLPLVKYKPNQHHFPISFGSFSVGVSVGKEQIETT